jgi:hypothetical protein
MTSLHGATAAHRAAWFVDWRVASGPQAVGAGVGLLRAAEKHAGTLLTLQGSADTRRILPHLGWKQCDAPRTWVRPLTSRYVASWARHHAAPLAALAGLPIATWWRLPRMTTAGIDVVAVDRLDASHDEVWRARIDDFPALMCRDSQYLNHFCADYPDGGYRIERITRSGRAVGHLIWRCDTDARGLARGRIVDLLWPRGESRLLATVLAHACRQLARAGADYVECLASVPELAAGLAALRFRPQRQVPIWYHRLPPGAPAPEQWHISLLDCDRAYR